MIKMIKLLGELFMVVSMEVFWFAVRIGSEQARCLSVTVIQLAEQLTKLWALVRGRSDVHHTPILTSKVISISDLCITQ